MPLRYNKKKAGHTRKDGYVFVKLSYTSIAVHKIIWCMLKGGWVEYPAFEIDHEDRNPSNNKIGSLRKVTKSQNQDNTKGRNGNTGIKGVYFDKHHLKYKAIICVGSSNRHLGYYADLQAAIIVRQQAEENKREGNFDSWYLSKREEFLG